MNITQFKYFYEVCKWESISKAAANLHVSQPTISIALKELEKTTKIKLFRRNGRKIALTEDAQILLGKITPILNILMHLEEEIADMSQNKNHIKLALPLQIGVQLLPKLFGEFKQNYPNIKLEIIESGGIDSLRLIESEEIDLAITNYDPNFSPNLNYQKLAKSELCFCTYPTHPLASRKQLTFLDIKDEPLVLLNGGFFINHIINKTYQEQNIPPNVFHYTTQLNTVKNILQHNLASSFLMKQAILPTDNLISIALENSPKIDSGIVMKKGKHIYKNERILINFVKKYYQNLTLEN